MPISDSQALERRQITVALVDDEALIRASLAQSPTAAGENVRSSQIAGKLLERIASKQPSKQPSKPYAPASPNHPHRPTPRLYATARR
jgi:hypothetical protein